MRFILVLLFAFALFSCEEAVVVKPPAKLRLQYNDNGFQKLQNECPYTFEVNKNATVEATNNCGLKIEYPSMKAAVFITYQKVKENNIKQLLYEAQKLAYNHRKKAINIPERAFVNEEANASGMYFEINGDVASQAQFYVTDSTNHFVNGALYFKTKPNFDSLYPAIQFVREDIRRMMETFEWKE